MVTGEIMMSLTSIITRPLQLTETCCSLFPIFGGTVQFLVELQRLRSLGLQLLCPTFDHNTTRHLTSKYNASKMNIG